MSANDEDLFKRWQLDPSGTFPLIYDRYASVLFRYIYRFSGQRQIAEEILHDVFVEILKDTYRPQSADHFKSWLFTVAKNKSLNVGRGKGREVFSEESLRSAEDPSHMEENLSAQQTAREFSRAEEALPEELASTWRLRKEGHDYQEISLRLGIPIGTVKSRFHRLVSYFQKELNLEKK